ncbi:MAG: DNA repair protein RecO [Patescibacteria group bacterium]
MLYKTQGIIIKSANLGEIDRLITVYTKDFGKLAVKGKSIRKNQAKLKGHLELFLHSHLMIAPARGFDIITGAETIERFSQLRQDLSSLAIAYYFSELIDKLVVGPEKDEDIWQLLLTSFQKLNQPNQKTGSIIKEFESNLSEFLGYGQQKDFLNFAESLAGERINSCCLLTKF